MANRENTESERRKWKKNRIYLFYYRMNISSTLFCFILSSTFVTKEEEAMLRWVSNKSRRKSTCERKKKIRILIYFIFFEWYFTCHFTLILCICSLSKLRNREMRNVVSINEYHYQFVLLLREAWGKIGERIRKK
jgi:hypothetical protein